MAAAPRSFHHSDFPLERLRDERSATVSVCVPARECAATIERVASELATLCRAGAIDEVVVVDAASADGTAALAERAGAVVRQEADLMPGFGPAEGKGDAMWRALSVLSGDVVCFLDGDTEDFARHFALGLAGAVACEDGVAFAKGFFRRPFRVGDVELPEGGGRVNELTARPLLRAFYPELAGIRQPLAGEVAARRDLLERLPFATGYAVETAMLLDVHREVGIDGIAQVDLDERRNPHQPLPALAPMADAVLGAVLARLRREGRLRDKASAAAEPPERPPMAAARSNLETARRAFTAIRAGDRRGTAAELHPDAEWHNTAAFPGPGTCTGPDAIVGFWASLMEGFEDGGTEIEEVAEQGNQVVMGVHTWGRGKGSGIPLDVRWAAVFHLRDARVARVDVHGDYAKALRAAGLRE